MNWFLPVETHRPSQSWIHLAKHFTTLLQFGVAAEMGIEWPTFHVSGERNQSVEGSISKKWQERFVTSSGVNASALSKSASKDKEMSKADDGRLTAASARQL
jgi:hypothetical protein